MSGPKCFLMYINNLVTQLPLYKFVDDSTVFEICNTNEVSVIQESIDVAVEWTVNNDMEINPDKSKEVFICFSKNVNFRNNVPNVVVEGN